VTEWGGQGNMLHEFKKIFACPIEPLGDDTFEKHILGSGVVMGCRHGFVFD